MSQEVVRKVTRTKKLIVAGAVLGGLLVSGAVSVYVFPDTGFSRVALSRMYLPVAFLSAQRFVTSREWEQNARSTFQLYTEHKDDLLKAGISIDFSGPDGEKLFAVKRKEILNKMIEDLIIEQLATERGISVSEADLNQNVDAVLQKNGNDQQFRQRLSSEYGWSMDDFKRIVVRPELLSEGLEAFFNKQKQDDGEAKKRIVSAQKQLASGGAFADVSKQYSEGATAQDAGDLGWLAVGSIAPEIATVVKDQALHVPTGIIETSLGYHIILVDERRQQGDTTLVHLRQIFARKQTYPEWLEAQKRQMNIWMPLRGYRWNRESGRVEFTDENRRHFEENVRQEAAGLIL